MNNNIPPLCIRCSQKMKEIKALEQEVSHLRIIVSTLLKAAGGTVTVKDELLDTLSTRGIISSRRKEESLETVFKLDEGENKDVRG